jgi:hypothetical protein
MRRLMKYLFRLLILLAAAFVAWALLAELPPPVRETVIPLTAPQAQQ